MMYTLDRKHQRSVNLDDRNFERVTALAAERMISVSATIRQLIAAEWAKNNPAQTTAE
jgi:hypothetical protein